MRVSGFVAFEKLIRIGHRDRLAEPRTPTFVPGRPTLAVAR
jgi:hypothetical protein